MVTSRKSTGMMMTGIQLALMRKVLFMSHISNNHQPHSNSTPTQGWKKNCVNHMLTHVSSPPGSTICSSKKELLHRNKLDSCSFQRKSDSKNNNRQPMTTRAAIGRAKGGMRVRNFILSTIKTTRKY